MVSLPAAASMSMSRPLTVGTSLTASRPITKDALRMEEGLHSHEYATHLRHPVLLHPEAHAYQPYWRSFPGERSKAAGLTHRQYQIATAHGEEAAHFSEALRHHGYRGDALNVDSYLLDRPLDVNMPCNFDMGTCLHIASMKGHSGLTERLIHRGADLNAGNHAKQTSLHNACEANNADVVYQLLSAGADADQKDTMGQTPLHRAAFTGSCDAVVALLDYGANMRIRDQGELLAIHKAATMGRAAALGLLLQRAPNTVNAEAANGWTCLHLAAHGGHVAACETLLAHRADVNAADSERMRPLHRAATSARQGEAVCQVLIQAGANLAAMDISRATPLHTACEEGFPSAARTLLEAGAPLEALDNRRCTPLHVAAEGGHAELCEVLMQFGADPNAMDVSRGVPSPLSVARRNRNQELIALFQQDATQAAPLPGAL